MFKKTVYFIFFVCASLCFSSCKRKNNLEDFNKSINVSSEKDASVFSIIGLKNKSDENLTRNKYEFSFFSDNMEVLADIANRKCDIAFLPANLAAILYNKTNGEILVYSINALNNLYLLSGDPAVHNIIDLKDKTLVMLKKDLNLKPLVDILVNKNNLENVTIKIVNDEKDLLNEDTKNLNILLTEPDCTKIFNTLNLKDLKIINLAREWEKISNNHPLPSSCLVVRKSFYKKNKSFFENFILDYGENCQFSNNDITKTSFLAKEFFNLDEENLKNSIAKCNLTNITGKNMVRILKNFLTILYSEDPDLIGGKLPLEDFYIKD